jgi:hypothetical protein
MFKIKIKKNTQCHVVTTTFDTGRVEVCVEHDDGKGENKDRVRVAQSSHDLRIALAVALAKDFHEPLDFLGFAGHAEVSLETSQSHVNVQSGEIQLFDEKIQCRHVE